MSDHYPEPRIDPRIDFLVGDCLEVFPTLPRDRVDLVFCSPPYEDRRTYSMGYALAGEHWVRWAVARFEACLEVVKPGGLVAWVVNGQQDRFRWSATPALLMADLHRRGACLREPPIFARVGIPGSGGRDWLRNDRELIVCATRGRGPLAWADNLAMGAPAKYSAGGNLSHRTADGRRKNSGATSTPRKYRVPDISNPGNLIRCKVGGGVMGDRLCHANEAPFPERLAEFFIRSFCPPGGTVLDPFAGSGTTAAVAKRWGRDAIAVDIRHSQIRLARRRVARMVAHSGPAELEAARLAKLEAERAAAEAELQKTTIQEASA